jgi:3-phosphoshikimate 1-carboxyvinyltransferase
VARTAVSLSLMTSEHEYWMAPVATRINATVHLPGSKSLTNRELVLSALAQEQTLLISPLKSRDSQLMIAALSNLGTEFSWQGQNLLVTPRPLSGPARIDCGLAGTVMRFVPPLSLLAKGKIEFDGDAGARRRPMATTIESLEALGARVERQNAALPFSVESLGYVETSELEIDASASSQFVSGLLLAAASFRNGLTLRHSGKELPSLPHIEMTIETLRNRGVEAKLIDERTWVVKPGPIQGGEITIEPDLSNAGPFLAAAMVAGGTIRIPNWPAKTTQVGALFAEILPQMGASVAISDGYLELNSNGEIHGIEIDLSVGGELAPVIAALATLADSPSRITGIAHLRGHETDRLAALTSQINAIGGNAKELPDGLEITPAKLIGGKWETYEDHRMATAAAIIGLRVPGIEIENIGTTAKTMPEFTSLWTNMIAGN